MRSDPKYLQTMASHLTKANPPEVLYRYRRPCDWALKEISEPHVHIASPEDMNDPFESRAPLHYNLSKLKNVYAFVMTQRGATDAEARLEAERLNDQSIASLKAGIEDLRRDSGLICLSSDPRSNRMWAYYAECHRGICITYDARLEPFSLARSVLYEDPKEPLDAMEAHAGDLTRFADHVSLRKGKEWEFEQEYRVYVGPFENGHTRTLPIKPGAILEVRLGTNISPEFKEKVMAAANALPVRPKIFQMECDYEGFQLIEILI